MINGSVFLYIRCFELETFVESMNERNVLGNVCLCGDGYRWEGTYQFTF